MNRYRKRFARRFEHQVMEPGIVVFFTQYIRKKEDGCFRRAGIGIRAIGWKSGWQPIDDGRAQVLFDSPIDLVANLGFLETHRKDLSRIQKRLGLIVQLLLELTLNVCEMLAGFVSPTALRIEL